MSLLNINAKLKFSIIGHGGDYIISYFVLPNISAFISTCPIWFIFIGFVFFKINFKSIALVYGFFYLIVLSFYFFNGYSTLFMEYFMSLNISSVLFAAFYFGSWRKIIKDKDKSKRNMQN